MIHSHLNDSQQSGFTLIELVIVISVMAILASLAYPSMQRQIAQARINQTIGDLDSAFKTARANAIIQKRNVNVSVNGATGVIRVEGVDGTQFTLSKKIAITQENGLSSSTLTFTNNKTVMAGNSTLTDGQGFGVCYRGVSTQKWIITVDSRSNIQLNKNGGACS